MGTGGSTALELLALLGCDHPLVLQSIERLVKILSYHWGNAASRSARTKPAPDKTAVSKESYAWEPNLRATGASSPSLNPDATEEHHHVQGL